jgi:hypothetical protein
MIKLSISYDRNLILQPSEVICDPNVLGDAFRTFNRFRQICNHVAVIDSIGLLILAVEGPVLVFCGRFFFLGVLCGGLRKIKPSDIEF